MGQATAPADVIMAVEQQLRQAQRGQPRVQPPPNRPRGGVPPSPAPAAHRPPSPDMSRYMNSGGGCFAASCTVRLHPDGLGGAPSSMSSMVRTVRMDQIRKGDKMTLADGGYATVVCVGEVQRPRDKPLVALPGGLQLTPKHPVRLPAVPGTPGSGRWVLPETIQPADAPHDGAVYNLILDRGHIIEVDGWAVCTWGHGLEDLNPNPTSNPNPNPNPNPGATNFRKMWCGTLTTAPRGSS